MPFEDLPKKGGVDVAPPPDEDTQPEQPQGQPRLRETPLTFEQILANPSRSDEYFLNKLAAPTVRVDTERLRQQRIADIDAMLLRLKEDMDPNDRTAQRTIATLRSKRTELLGGEIARMVDEGGAAAKVAGGLQRADEAFRGQLGTNIGENILAVTSPEQFQRYQERLADEGKRFEELFGREPEGGLPQQFDPFAAGLSDEQRRLRNRALNPTKVFGGIGALETLGAAATIPIDDAVLRALGVGSRQFVRLASGGKRLTPATQQAFDALAARQAAMAGVPTGVASPTEQVIKQQLPRVTLRETGEQAAPAATQTVRKSIPRQPTGVSPSAASLPNLETSAGIRAEIARLRKQISVARRTKDSASPALQRQRQSAGIGPGVTVESLQKELDEMTELLAHMERVESAEAAFARLPVERRTGQVRRPVDLGEPAPPKPTGPVPPEARLQGLTAGGRSGMPSRLGTEVKSPGTAPLPPGAEVPLSRGVRAIDQQLLGGRGIQRPVAARGAGEAAAVVPPAPTQATARTGGALPFRRTPQEQAVTDRFLDVLGEAKVRRDISSKEVTAALGKKKAVSEEALRKGDRAGAIAAFRGELPKPGNLQALEEAFTPAEGEMLRSMIDRRFFTQQNDIFKWMQAQTAFTELFSAGAIPPPSRLTLLADVYGKEFIEVILKKRSLGSKAWDLFREIWNIPRAMQATGDLSATLRQSPILATTHRRVYADAMVAQVKAFKDEAAATASRERILAHPLYGPSQRAGLDLTMTMNQEGEVARAFGSFAQREEPFIGARLLAKTKNLPVISIYGRTVEASERAYVTMLNEVRFWSFVDDVTKLGEKATENDLAGIARGINILSGRASFGRRATEFSQLINGLFYAPRFAVSRFQVPFLVFSGSAAARKMAAKALVSYTTTVTSMLALADLAGIGTVEWDPRSSDFGKLKIGRTRIDPWAGVQQPVVLMTRMLTGLFTENNVKSATTGELRQGDWRDLNAYFLENKLAPAASLLFDIQRGEGFGGKGLMDPSPLPAIPNVVWENTTFLWIQDALEAAQAEGPVRGSLVGALTFLGLSAGTYGDDYDEAVYDTHQQFREALRGIDHGLVLGQVPNTIRENGVTFTLSLEQQAEYQKIMAQTAIMYMQAFYAGFPMGTDVTSEYIRELAKEQMAKAKDDARNQALYLFGVRDSLKGDRDPETGLPR